MDFKFRPKPRNLGLTPKDVGEQVRNAFYGALAMRQLQGSNEAEVRVSLLLEERKYLNNLKDFVIRTSEGTEVPLLDVVSVEQREAFTDQ